MPRPTKKRRIQSKPSITTFRPAGILVKDLQSATLTLDEYEAIRLKDLMGLEQESAAREMNISQPTFHRLLLTARRKLADGLINGKAINFKGGNVEYVCEKAITKA